MGEAAVLISIAICTRNRARSLRATLQSIGRCDVPEGLAVEAIVVDNGSTDDTRAVVEHACGERFSFRHLLEPRVGKGNAYNTVLAHARGEAILFTDDDVLVPKDWIAGMTRKLLSGEADAVQGGVRVAPHLRRRWLLDAFPAIAASTEGMVIDEPDFLIGANMALSRRVLELVPRFDPELGPGALGFGEDTLYARQLIAAGYRIRSELGVVVEHHFDQSRLASKAVLDTCRKMGRCKAYLAYHWDHDGLWSFDWSGCIRRTLAYSWRCAVKPGACEPDMPRSLWRTPAIEAAAFVRQYVHERRRGRHYTRGGLSRTLKEQQGERTCQAN